MTARRAASAKSAGVSVREFSARVFAAVSRIRPGQVATYGDVAHLAGRPKAPRAVGQLMRNANRPGLPYHRVVAAGGRIGGYGASGAAMKAALLQAEGIVIEKGRIVDFAGVRMAAGPRSSPSKAQRRDRG